MFSSRTVARLRTISRTKATRILVIVCTSQTVVASGLKCQDFCRRRGFEERQHMPEGWRIVSANVSDEPAKA